MPLQEGREQEGHRPTLHMKDSQGQILAMTGAIFQVKGLFDAAPGEERAGRALNLKIWSNKHDEEEEDEREKEKECMMCLLRV